MTEPKIVHLPPREKNPAREPNETWDAGERLFGLEELLLHMPPIRKLHLERGRLKDLVRLYPDMKREFAAPELLPQPAADNRICLTYREHKRNRKPLPPD